MFYKYKRHTEERVGVNQQCKLQWKQWLKETKCPMSIRAVAAKFDIPYPTLRKHIIKGSATMLLGRFRRTFSNDQESELVCITRPVSCLWHGWSSYTAWPFTVSVHYSWFSHRLDSVVHHESLADVSFAGDVSTESVVTCGVHASRQRFGPSSFFYILLMSQTLHCAVVWTFIHMPTIPIITSTVMQWTV